MFAVMKTGGKQYRVAAEDVITIERLDAQPGEIVTFNTVLMLDRGGAVEVGAPNLAGVAIAAEVLALTRGPKVIAFKKRRRQNSKRKRGHRQDHTSIRITEILLDGAAPSVKARGLDAPSSARDPSNLSLISGIGPTIEKKLRAAGITSWNDIAGWSDEDLAKWDKDLNLRGRAKREEWIEQAKELLAGKPPRAKIDQAEQASGEDL
jgi:large subunit ribosomal protein L21